MKKDYETDNDYILEILEDEEDNLIEELCEKLSNDMLFTFSKFLAVRNEIEKINKNSGFNIE